MFKIKKTILFQFDFPFIEVIRVKEFRFRLRLPIGFQYKDRNFSELDYEINRQEKKLEAATKSTDILEISDLSDSDNDTSRVSTPKSVDKIPTVQSKDSLKVTKVTNNNKIFKKSKSVQQFDKKELKRTTTETSIETFDIDDETDSDLDSDSDEEICDQIVVCHAKSIFLYILIFFSQFFMILYYKLMACWFYANFDNKIMPLHSVLITSIFSCARTSHFTPNELDLTFYAPLNNSGEYIVAGLSVCPYVLNSCPAHNLCYLKLDFKTISQK